MVPGQHGHAGLLPRLDQPRGARDGVADRLLHDHRDAGGDALQAAVDVQLVGRGEDDAVGLAAREQFGQRRVQRNAELLGQLRARGPRVDDRRQFRLREGVDLLDVPGADEARSGDGDAGGCHGVSLPCRRSASCHHGRSTSRGPFRRVEAPLPADGPPYRWGAERADIGTLPDEPGVSALLAFSLLGAPPRGAGRTGEDSDPDHRDRHDDHYRDRPHRRPCAQGAAPGDVGARRLPGRGHRRDPRAGARPRRRDRRARRRPGARRGRRHRERRRARRARRRRRGGLRPDPGAVRGRSGVRRATRRDGRVGGGRRRGAALRRRQLRRRAVLRRRDVRPAPPARRRRAGPRVPPGRADRPAELDAHRVRRRDVPDDEAVRAPAAARRPAAAAVGRRGPRPGPARRPGHRRRRPAADADHGPLPDARGVAGVLEERLRADDRGLPAHRRRPRARSRRSTAT